MTADTTAFERATIGGLLFSWSEHWPKCEAAGLCTDSFEDQFCRRVLAACLKLHGSGDMPDLRTIGELLPGEIVQLSRLVDDAVTPSLTTAYARRVVDAARNRRLLLLLADAKRKVESGEDASTLFDEIAELRTPGESSERFPRIRLSDLQNHDPDDGSILAGNGWLRRGAGTLITGSTGIGKSVLAEQLNACACSAIPFFGIHIREPLRVLHLAVENDETTLQRDYLSILKNIDGKPCPLLVQSRLDVRRVYGIAGAEFFAWLERICKTTKPDLIVFDPLQGFLPAADVNKSETYLGFIQGVDPTLKRHNAGAVIVCHTPKPSDRQGWTDRESVYLAVGSSVLANWCRTSAELTAAGEDGRYRLRCGKNCERTGLSDETGHLVRDIFISHSGNLREPYWKLAEDQNPGVMVVSKWKNKIIELSRKEPGLSRRDIAKRLGCSIGTVSTWYSKDS